MSQITLYYVNGACSLVPHILLCQLGIPFKSVPMKFRPGDNGLEAVDGSLSNAEYRKVNKDMYPVVRAKGMKNIEYSYGIIEKRLRDRTYVVGEHLTLVDLFVYVLWGWGGRLAHIEMEEKYPAYTKLVQRVEALHGVRKAVEEEGQPLHFE
ncbi:hypothetical protein F4824DRAFT_502068 [Ustulina deusta]|nr:hypothetical protein F4824DRAFT_502068 [Ustulina deusta]